MGLPQRHRSTDSDDHVVVTHDTEDTTPVDVNTRLSKFNPFRVIEPPPVCAVFAYVCDTTGAAG